MFSSVNTYEKTLLVGMPEPWKRMVCVCVCVCVMIMYVCVYKCVEEEKSNKKEYNTPPAAARRLVVVCTERSGAPWSLAAGGGERGLRGCGAARGGFSCLVCKCRRVALRQQKVEREEKGCLADEWRRRD